MSYGQKKSARSSMIVDDQPDRYETMVLRVRRSSPERIQGPIRPDDLLMSTDRMGRWWRSKQLKAKPTQSPWAKASATFDGGVDYIAWKIIVTPGPRSSQPWSDDGRASAISLLPRLLKSGRALAGRDSADATALASAPTVMVAEKSYTDQIVGLPPRPRHSR